MEGPNNIYKKKNNLCIQPFVGAEGLVGDMQVYFQANVRMMCRQFAGWTSLLRVGNSQSFQPNPLVGFQMSNDVKQSDYHRILTNKCLLKTLLLFVYNYQETLWGKSIFLAF